MQKELEKGKGKSSGDQPQNKRFSWRIWNKTSKEANDKLRASRSQPLLGDTSDCHVDLSSEEEEAPPQPVLSLPGFYSTGLAPPDQSQVPPSPNLCVNQGNWSDIQRWFDENHAEERGLTPPPREHHLSQRNVDIAHQPRVEDYDKDYLRYLQELPEEEDEEHHISSIQENEPEEPRYTPRAPNQYSDTREWYCFHEELALSARPVQSPPTLESSQGGSSLRALGYDECLCLMFVYLCTCYQ
nr:hypothetical protein Iba_chr05eCG9640 [Ipomoea batatas]